MTTLIDNRIDELISRVKKHGAITDFCFIPAYPPNKTPNPVKKYTVAAENLGTKEKRVFIGNRAGRSLNGRLYEVKLRLRVYAPSYTSGSSLLRACALLADALEAEDRRSCQAAADASFKFRCIVIAHYFRPFNVVVHNVEPGIFLQEEVLFLVAHTVGNCTAVYRLRIGQGEEQREKSGKDDVFHGSDVEKKMPP